MQIRLKSNGYWGVVDRYGDDVTGHTAGWMWRISKRRGFLHLYAIPQHFWFNVDIRYVLSDSSVLQDVHKLRIFSCSLHDGMWRQSLTTANAPDNIDVPLLEITNVQCDAVCNWLNQVGSTLTADQAERRELSQRYNDWTYQDANTR